ncbi:MAG: hypothetical protein U9N60_06715 [Thermodesulfobacteriota bacterium]|nr:hypothetical protein [Thermodesulfobacteriota bacterium]
MKKSRRIRIWDWFWVCMARWMAGHSLELISSYPVGDNWHGEQSPDKMFEMTDNVYVIKTDRNRYAKMRVFSAWRCLVSL